MPTDYFSKRKRDTFSKHDKSSKSYWDKKISNLCKKINSLKNYYTTSSCSGRIVLMVDQNKKAKGLFIKVYHDLITFKQLKRDLNNITKLHSQARDIGKNQLTKRNKGLISSKRIRASGNKQEKLIKFKQESCILHVACKSFDDAVKILEKAKLSGWKRSGIISFKKRYIVEAISTEKLEFPIIEKEKILVNEDFLRIIVEKSNENLKKSWEKIKRFEKLLK